jgi:hypothetical protein
MIPIDGRTGYSMLMRLLFVLISGARPLSSDSLISRTLGRSDNPER